MLELLRAQIEKLYQLDFYRRRLAQASLKPADIKSLADFARIPFTSSAEFQAEIRKKPRECSLYNPQVTRINFSPSGEDLYPVYQTAADLERMHQVCARTLRAAGVTSQDLAAITFGYHLFIAGLFYQNQFEYYGAKAIPLGPGESERAVRIINDYEVTVLVSNPTFAMKLAEQGIPSLRTLFVGGEPFTSVEGYPARVKAAFSRPVAIIDSYSMANCMPIARSCQRETGLHIMDEFVYAEVIDPASGQLVAPGEKGELVLTHLHKQAAPLLRYRTGDLTVIEETPCACGRRLTMPKGIIGRTDDMLKVKGVKFWPSQVGTVLRSYPGLFNRYRVQVSSSRGVDSLRLLLEGDPANSALLDGLAERLKTETLVKFNQIEIVEKLAPGPLVVDGRAGRKF
ncbi:MAG: phenylacetate--CoA ligase family protein [Desulfarculus sp.]|nr:MAG: phenylacetate--CoA ligase family protein [Desulfarculus sp.]